MFNWFIGFAVNWRKILCIGSLDYGNLMYDSKWWNVSWYPSNYIFYHYSLQLRRHYKHCLQPLRFMLWRKGETAIVTWILWDHLAIPKWSRVVALLYLEMHMVAYRFALLWYLCQQYKPWRSMMEYFIEHEILRLVHGKTKIQASWW